MLQIDLGFVHKVPIQWKSIFFSKSVAIISKLHTNFRPREESVSRHYKYCPIKIDNCIFNSTS